MLNDSITTTDNNESDCSRIDTTIRILNTTIPLVWLILGTITNGLSLFVFSRRSLRYNSTFIYLALMTLSDFVVIWFTAFRDFLVYKFQIYIAGTLLCRLHVFIFFVSCQWSSWLLTAANLDRLIYVICYGQAKKWCHRTVAFRVAFLLLVVLALMNVHFLFFVYSDRTDLGPEELSKLNLPSIQGIVYPYCLTTAGDYTHFYTNIFGWIDAFVFSFIPFIIMAICNTALISKVFSTKRNLNKRPMMKTVNALVVINKSTAGTTEDLTNLNNDANNLITGGVSSPTAVNGTLSPSISNNNLKVISKRTPNSSHSISSMITLKKNRSQSLSNVSTMVNKAAIKAAESSSSSDRMRNMAITIIGCTFLFIIFTLPINIYVPISHSSSDDDDDQTSSTKKKCDDLLFCILNNIVNANHSINFFIYLLTNSKFRKEIKQLLDKISSCLEHYFTVLTRCCGFRINLSSSASPSQENNCTLSNLELQKAGGPPVTAVCAATNTERTVVHKKKQSRKSGGGSKKKSHNRNPNLKMEYDDVYLTSNVASSFQNEKNIPLIDVSDYSENQNNTSSGANKTSDEKKSSPSPLSVNCQATVVPTIDDSGSTIGY